MDAGEDLQSVEGDVDHLIADFNHRHARVPDDEGDAQLGAATLESLGTGELTSPVSNFSENSFRCHSCGRGAVIAGQQS